MARIIKVSADCTTVEGEIDTLQVLMSLDDVVGATYRVVNDNGDEINGFFRDRGEAIEWACDYADFSPDNGDGWYDDGDNMTDVEADADVLASAGWGTDEDYGFFGDDF